MEGPQEICSSFQKANCKPTRNHVVPPVSHRAKSEPRMPPPQHPGNSKQVVPSGRMNQVVPPWRTEKRPSAVLTPARGISPKAGSPPPSPIIKVKEEFEPDWGGEEPATPGTPPGTPPETSQRIQPEAPSQTQSGAPLRNQPRKQPGAPPGNQPGTQPIGFGYRAISHKLCTCRLHSQRCRKHRDGSSFQSTKGAKKRWGPSASIGNIIFRLSVP